MTKSEDGASGGASDVIPEGSSETKTVDSAIQHSITSTLPDDQVTQSIPARDYDVIRQAQADSVAAANKLLEVNDSLQRRIAEADVRIAELEGENSYLTEEYVEADKNVRKAEARLGEAQNALAETRREFAETNENYDSFVKDHQEVIRTAVQMKDELYRLQGIEAENKGFKNEGPIERLHDKILHLIEEVEEGRRSRQEAEKRAESAETRADKAEFKLRLNDESDDVKELYSREGLETRVKAMMREVAIPTFNVDFAAAAFMDQRYRHPDIVCEKYELLPEFFMRSFLDDQPDFILTVKKDVDLFGWFLSSAFDEAFDLAMNSLAVEVYEKVRIEYKKDNPDADTGTQLTGIIELEDMRAELDAELNRHDSVKDKVLNCLKEYVLANVEHTSLPLDVKGRGMTGVLLAGRKKEMPVSISYGNSIEKGAKIARLFDRSKPLDTDEMKEYWNVFCEQVDDMAAAYKDERVKDSFARYLEDKFGKNPFSSATMDGSAETISDLDIDSMFIVFYDSDNHDDRELKRQRVGMNAELIDKMDLERLMSHDTEVVESEIRSRWGGEYNCAMITSDDEVIGNVISLKETHHNQFEKSTLDILANNLSRKCAQHYRQLREHRVALSKKVSLRVIDEGRDIGKTVRGSMSVLYADVCGFTQASEVIDPADMTAILNLFFENAREITDGLDITHDKTMGDCTMELVGPPYLDVPPQAIVAQGKPVEYASRGVECLLQFRERMAILNELYFQDPEHLKGYGEATQKYLRSHPVQVSMGIASGIADFCKLGASISPDYTAVGPVVNLASRVEGFADADQIAVCPETLLLLMTGKVAETRDEKETVIPHYTSEGLISYDERYIFTPIGHDSVKLKGVDKPQRLYEVNRNPDYKEKD